MQLSKTSINIRKTGARLKDLAKCNGYSVKDIQEYLGLYCPQSIYRWYKGKILPSIDNLLRLSELYDMHMEELLVKDNAKVIFIFETMAVKPDRYIKRINTYMSEMTA